MVDFIQSCVDMLGISLETPTNFAEFMPWFITVLVGFGFVFATFSLVRKMVELLCDKHYF